MILGLSGVLLSHDALEAARITAIPPDPAAVRARRVLMAWRDDIQRDAGPAWAARTVFDRIAVPFCRAFGLDVLATSTDSTACRGMVRRDTATVAALLATPWGQSVASAWRDAVRYAMAAGVRWCYCFTGPALAIVDAERTHSRRFVQLDLADVTARDDTFAVAWYLFAGDAAALDSAVLLSERHRVAVRDSLQSGVEDALGSLSSAFMSAARGRRRAGRDTRAVLDESLTIVYRVLFLLFAEARRLVPAWHPVFRDGYTVEALRDQIDSVSQPRGVWESLQAIARLAHHGCHAGTLRVPPFNGRLFSPAHAPLADSVPLDEAAVRNALVALTTRKTSAGRQRISYADLGVEQLGGVYERVLDYDLETVHGGVPRLVATGRRKATGTFYTPRALTEYLVRRTLTPLVKEAGPEEILSLRILDPAMGSGAFLVAACRFLASAYETALVRQGVVASSDLTDADRAGFRRTVAQRTLFGVDMNPMAVQLARLSLWLTTLASDRPLSFFDHHLRAGNSLVGASIADVRFRRSGRTQAHDAPLPLFDDVALDRALGAAAGSGFTLRVGQEDTVEQVRAKEALFAQAQSAGAPLARWKAIADLWCAGWFSNGPAPTRGMFEALIESAAGARQTLGSASAERLLQRGRDATSEHRFFHWQLEFPELFYDASGAPLEHAGFDAVLGNPPWEMLRGDTGDESTRSRAAGAGGQITRFARGSGIYKLQGTGHANLYQLFVERALMLVRPGGRIGLILPGGFTTDHGCAALRRAVVEETLIDSLVSVENREAIFPIHRGVKFALLTLTAHAPGRGTETIPLRTGVRSAAEFDRLPDAGSDPDAVPVSRRLIEKLSGDQCAIPDLHSPRDAAIAAAIAFSIPAAGSEDGWNLKFGRELNATDDRHYFNLDAQGLPVVEGKQLQPFAVDLNGSRHYIESAIAQRLLPAAPFERARVAYRDVAAATNRLTLIAAVLPRGAVTTHTLFCLKTPLEEDDQHCIAGLMNSFVANYLARLRVTTHVTVAIVEHLPLPKPPRSASSYAMVVEGARRLAARPDDTAAAARLQATAARLYGLNKDAFAHVLATFPLVDTSVRHAAMEAFIRTV